MSKTTSTLIAALAAIMLSGSAYAQSNNTLATPSVASPAKATSGYGTPGATSSESGSGAGASNSGQSNSMNSNSSSSLTNAPGSHNTLATPSVVSPAAGQ